MTDIPIIFSTPMVQALLREAGAPGTGKTMTRRLAWREIFDDFASARSEWMDAKGRCWAKTPWQRVRPGDRLWVRETWREDSSEYSAPGGHICARRAVLYRAGHDCADELKWAPSIHLARADSRLTLVVTATKIERLQEISDADAIAEGIYPGEIEIEGRLIKVWFGANERACDERPVDAFRNLWTMLHGTGSWGENPEVVALTFTVHLQNIDQMREAA